MLVKLIVIDYYDNVGKHRVVPEAFPLLTRFRHGFPKKASHRKIFREI